MTNQAHTVRRLALRAEQHERLGRRGFTLVEMLACLALSMLVITALYSASYQHYQLRSAGQAQIGNCQEVLGVVEVMHRDAQSARWVASDSRDSALERAEPESFLKVSRIEERVLELTPAEHHRSLGFWGAPDQFAFTVDRVAAAQESPTTDSASVWYGMTHGGGNRIPIGRVDRTVVFETSVLHDQPGQFSRGVIAGESGVEKASRSQSVARMLPLSTRIHRCGFRYFDGQKWFTEWDRRGGEEWPVAIEVTLFWIVGEDDRTNRELQQHRFVLSLKGVGGKGLAGGHTS